MCWWYNIVCANDESGLHKWWYMSDDNYGNMAYIKKKGGMIKCRSEGAREVDEGSSFKNSVAENIFRPLNLAIPGSCTECDSSKMLKFYLYSM